MRGWAKNIKTIHKGLGTRFMYQLLLNLVASGFS